MALLMRFAASMGMENQVEVLSLGKGQGPRAEEVIKVSVASNVTVLQAERLGRFFCCRDVQLV